MMPPHRIPLPGGDWQLWRPLLLRGAGFPAAAVLPLASAACVAAADRVTRSDAAARSAATRATDAVRAALDELQRRGEWSDKARRHPLLAARRALAAGRLPKQAVADPACGAAFAAWREAQAAAAAARAAQAETWEAESLRVSCEIDRLAADRRFREAVTWQNRHAVTTSLDVLCRHPAAPGNRTLRRRLGEELVASYLQRYCVKNETIGFFGPLGHGELAAEGPAVSVRPGPELLDRRDVYFETWCIEALARKLSADPALRPWLAPRLKSSLYLAPGGQLYPPDGELSAAQLRLLAACDGRRTAQCLARELVAEPGLGLDSEEAVYLLLAELCRRRIVSWELEVPLELHPERTLVRQLQRIEPEPLRAPALAALGALQRGREAVARAAGDERALAAALQELEETFTRHTDLAPRRRLGETYAARGLVYEDCRRWLEVRFGPELLTRLGPPLSLALQGTRWLAGEITRRVEERLLAVYERLRREGGGVPVAGDLFYAQSQAALFLKPERDAVFAETEQAYQERWADALGPAAAAPDQPLCVGSPQIAERCAELFGAAAPVWSLARYLCPDVLIAAPNEEALRRGEYQLVLGEMHACNTLLWSCFVAQHPDRERVLAALQSDAGTRVQVMPQLLKHNTPVRISIGVSLPQMRWFHYADAPPPGEQARVLPAGELVIERRDGRPWARSRDGGLSFAACDLFGLELTTACNQITGHLLPPAVHQPRVTVDGVVVARERWRVPISGLAGAAADVATERFRRIREWAAVTGLPRFCFYRAPGERKPRYLDLESPLFVDLFARQARAAGEGSSMSIVEMLPGLDQSWLPDAAGRRYACELRLVALRDEGFEP